MIPSAGPSITRAEIALVTDAITHGWYESRGKHTDQFVAEISDYLDMPYCLPLANCTAAIHLALLALDIGPGDEVIVPDITWVASAEPIVYVGATPVFADIDPISWCLDPDSFEQRITKKTKAVIVVDVYGNMPEMEKIRAIAKTHHIAIIEDAAEAMGSTYRGKPAGTFGTIGVFSFNATKLMIAGQGGMLVTRNRRIFEKAKLLARHGMKTYTTHATFWSTMIGYNYQWTNIQAAFALGQFRRLKDLVRIKRRAFGWYQKHLKGLNGFTLNSEAPGVLNTYWIVTGIVDPKFKRSKEELMEVFQNRYRIDLRPFFYPVSSMPPYVRYTKGHNMKKVNPVSYKIAPYGICLPSAMSLTEQQVNYVCDCLKKELQP